MVMGVPLTWGTRGAADMEVLLISSQAPWSQEPGPVFWTSPVSSWTTGCYGGVLEVMVCQ